MAKKKEPKIILWDLETSDLGADVGFLICGGWKELGKKKVHCPKMTDFDRYYKNPLDDRDLVAAIADGLRDADMIVAWYGKKFDEPFLQAKLLKYGLPPLPPIPQYDPWYTCRYRLRLTNNRMQTVTSWLGLQDKTYLDRKIWVQASVGHEPSIGYIVRHCVQDIKVLEALYLKLRPLASGQHPNLSLLTERPDACPRCGVEGRLQARGFNNAITRKSRRYQCTACKGWSQATTSEKGFRPEFK